MPPSSLFRFRVWGLRGRGWVSDFVFRIRVRTEHLGGGFDEGEPSWEDVRGCLEILPTDLKSSPHVLTRERERECV